MSNRIELGELETFLYDSADILRGHVEASDYKSYVFPLLFFKRICDVYDEETENAIAQHGEEGAKFMGATIHRFMIPDGHHWRNVRTVTENVGIAIKNAFYAIEQANEDSKTHEKILEGVFGDASWTNKAALPDEMLKNLIEHFSTKTLSIANCPEDELGQAYEYLIKKFGDDSGHTSQEFYTNRTVVHLMTEILNPQPGETVYDPTCGSAGMLISCIHYLRENNAEWRGMKCYGQEINPLSAAIGKMNLFLNGVLNFKIRDGATLPLNFETVPVELRVDQETIDEEFGRITEELTEEQKDGLAKRVKTEALIKAPDRVAKVCQHIFDHFKSKVEPNGFKGMVVCYDRESCVLFKEQLDILFGDEYHTAIVMDTNNDKANKYIAYRRSTDEEQKLLDKFRDPRIPLQLLIVTSKLLTGFDAPILQVQYLDKPMKDHTLLQAICRTNRVYGDKPNGLIVDYIGIFEKFARALTFDEESMRNVIKNIEGVKDKIPELVATCLAYFPGVDRTDSSWEGLASAQQCLPNDDVRDKFGADYRVLHKIWNIVSPDPCLQAYKFDYKWLSTVYESVRPSDDTGHLIWSALGPKTMELVRENITAIGVKENLAVIEADAEVIEQFINDKDKSKKAAKKIEISIAAIIRGHLDNPEFISLGERLEKLRKQHEQGLLYGAAFLKALLDLAKDTAAAVRKAQAETPEPPKEEKGKAALTELFNSVKNRSTPIIVERMVNEIDEIVKIVRFPGWKDTPQGRNDVEKALRSIFVKKKLFDNELFEKAYGYVEQYY